MKQFTDNDPMPFGKHKGKPMKDVPHQYFIHLHDHGKLKGAIREYAEANVVQLKILKENREGK